MLYIIICIYASKVDACFASFMSTMVIIECPLDAHYMHLTKIISILKTMLNGVHAVRNVENSRKTVYFIDKLIFTQSTFCQTLFFFPFQSMLANYLLIVKEREKNVMNYLH